MTQAKDHMFMLRLTRGQYLEIKRGAKLVNETMSEYLRVAARERERRSKPCLVCKGTGKERRRR